MTPPEPAPVGLVELLLVEDDESDILLTQRTLQGARLANKVHVVMDGAEAMQFLRREGKFASAPRPGLILLDLKLPKKDGFEVLAEMRADSGLRDIPVIVLAASAADGDVAAAYGGRANAFLVKPVRIEDVVRVLSTLQDLWLGLVALPPGQKPPGFEAGWAKGRSRAP